MRRTPAEYVQTSDAQTMRYIRKEALERVPVMALCAPNRIGRTNAAHAASQAYDGAPGADVRGGFVADVTADARFAERESDDTKREEARSVPGELSCSGFFHLVFYEGVHRWQGAKSGVREAMED